MEKGVKEGRMWSRARKKGWRLEAGGWRLETYPVRRIHEEDFNGDGWAEEEKASEGGMEDETNIRCPDRQ